MIDDSLSDVNDCTRDRPLAMRLAAEMVASERMPYCFSMSHNAGRPLYAPCPLPYDWKRKGVVGICTSSKSDAEQWLVKALLLHYTVERVDFKDHEPNDGIRTSLAHARTRARIALQRRMREHPDDDIPF